MSRSLSTTRGTAMLLGGILGPGTLILPRLAAESAGPAAIAAWSVLLLSSVPVALTYAALGERHPDGGGVAHFARLAFGGRASAITGLWFYCAVPVGTVGGALVGGRYAAELLGANSGTGGFIACALLGAACAANAIGLHASGRVQTVLVLALAALLTIATAVAAPHVQAHRYAPFAPHGVTGVAAAIGVLVFAFVGWEAVTHLSAEFGDERGGDEAGLGPVKLSAGGRSLGMRITDDGADLGPVNLGAGGVENRSLRRATWLALGIIGFLYLSLAIVSAGTGATTSPVPLQALLAPAIGRLATPLVGVAAVFLTFGAINTYIAGAARLGASLAREGILPHRFADAPDREPRRSLGLLGAATGLIAAAALIWTVDVDVLMRAAAGCLAAVNVIGMTAAVRLLPGGRPRRVAVTALILTIGVSACCSLYLLIPTGLAAVGWVAGSRRRLPISGHRERSRRGNGKQLVLSGPQPDRDRA